MRAGSGIHAFSLRRNLIEPAWNKGNPYTGIEMSYNGITAEEADFHKIPDDEEFMKVMFAAEPEIIDAFVKTPEAENLMRRFTVLRSMPFFLEFLNPRGSKGQSLMLLADDLGIRVRAPSRSATRGTTLTCLRRPAPASPWRTALRTQRLRPIS